MRLIRYEFTERDEMLSSHSGLALIGALLNRTRLCGQESLREDNGTIPLYRRKAGKRRVFMPAFQA